MFPFLLAESARPQHGSKQLRPSVPILAVEIMPKQITDARAKAGGRCMAVWSSLPWLRILEH